MSDQSKFIFVVALALAASWLAAFLTLGLWYDGSQVVMKTGPLAKFEFQFYMPTDAIMNSIDNIYCQPVVNSSYYNGIKYDHFTCQSQEWGQAHLEVISEFPIFVSQSSFYNLTGRGQMFLGYTYYVTTEVRFSVLSLVPHPIGPPLTNATSLWFVPGFDTAYPVVSDNTQSLAIAVATILAISFFLQLIPVVILLQRYLRRPKHNFAFPDYDFMGEIPAPPSEGVQYATRGGFLE